MKILRPNVGKFLKMGTTPSPIPKWQSETNAVANIRSPDLLLTRMHAAILLLSIAIN